MTECSKGNKGSNIISKWIIEERVRGKSKGCKKDAGFVLAGKLCEYGTVLFVVFLREEVTTIAFGNKLERWIAACVQLPDWEPQIVLV